MVHFKHQATSSQHEVFSHDAAMVELRGVAKKFHLDPDSLELMHGTSGRFAGVSTSGAVSLAVLRQHFAGEGTESQPFVVDGAPEAGKGNGHQIS